VNRFRRAHRPSLGSACRRLIGQAGTRFRIGAITESARLLLRGTTNRRYPAAGVLAAHNTAVAGHEPWPAQRRCARDKLPAQTRVPEAKRAVTDALFERVPDGENATRVTRRWPGSTEARSWNSPERFRSQNRAEATEALHGLVGAIVMTPAAGSGELAIELRGNLAAMLGATVQRKRSSESDDLSRQVAFVAGACNQRYLQLWNVAS
jgi:hypothetical protein